MVGQMGHRGNLGIGQLPLLRALVKAREVHYHSAHRYCRLYMFQLPVCNFVLLAMLLLRSDSYIKLFQPTATR